jgi:hypothetical protein
MTDKYRLVNRKPVLCEDLKEWGNSFEKENRIVAQTQVTAGIKVSTAFIGIDDNYFGNGPPLLFETMVLGGPLDGIQERSSTWEEAEIMHREMVSRVMESIV